MGFIKFYNCFMDSKSNYYLTPKSWMYYAIISTYHNQFYNESHITINMIYDVQTAYKKNDKEASTIKQKILSDLDKLKQLGIIEFTVKDTPEKKKADYNEVIIFQLTDIDSGFEKIGVNLYKAGIADPFYLYSMCVCQRFKNTGYKAKHEVIAKLMDCSVAHVKRNIKSMLDEKLIEYRPSIRKQSENGQFSSTSNAYFLHHDYLFVEDRQSVQEEDEEVIEIPRFIDVCVPGKKGDVDRTTRFDVETEIRAQIRDSTAKLWYQHYYYAYKYQAADPLTYKKYIERRRKMESGGFDFSDYDSRFENDMKHEKRIKAKEINEKNKKSLLTQYGVCIQLDDDSIVSHKDKFDWSKMKNFHYKNEDGSEAYTDVKDKYPIYEAILPKYDVIDYRTLIDEISPYIRQEKKIDSVGTVKDEDDEE